MEIPEVRVMSNMFHEIEQIVREEEIDFREAVHALLAATHLECCENCSSKLRSTEFQLSLQHMLKELKLCKQLTRENVT
jgi:hypothetical protein